MIKALRNMDKTLLIVTIILSIFGVCMILSASSVAAVYQYKESEYYFAVRQAIVLIGASILGLLVLVFPTKYYKAISFFGIVGIIIVLVLLRTYGTVTNSAKSWLSIGSFSLQPSEFAKTFIILYLGCFYGAIKKFNVNNSFQLFVPLIPCVLIFLLVAAEPDMGTAIIIASICIFIFLSLPFNKWEFIKRYKYLLLLGIIVLVLLFMNLDKFLTSTQEARLLHFQNPCSRYLEDSGYQVCNGYIAINNGGLFGVGLGKSTQKYLYLPEAHTDFIFPIIIEELGLVGGGVIFILYIVLLYRILVIARNANSLRGSIIAFGTFGYILTHIVVNLGGVLALIPLTGVPLPFLSYGGSFLLNLIILLSLTQRVAIEKRIGV